MERERTHTRRSIVKGGVALGASVVGLGAVGTAAANPGRGDEQGNGRSFGRVYANGTLWRTNVVRTLAERPSPEDLIYFLHDGQRPIVANPDVGAAQASPFVSESAPGDRDWNGGKWVHVSAEVTDVEAFDEDAPVDSASEVLDAEYVETSLGRPGFGPPDYFICPLNGRD